MNEETYEALKRVVEIAETVSIYDESDEYDEMNYHDDLFIIKAWIVEVAKDYEEANDR